MKVKKHIDDCSIGDLVAEDVYTDSFNIPIVIKGTPLDEKVIEKLRLSGIYNLYIEESSPNIEFTDASSFEDKTVAFANSYEEELLKFKEVFANIVSGKRPRASDVNNMTQNLIKSSSDIFRVVESLNFLETIDEYTYNHSLNVALYSMLIARWLNLSEDEIEEVVKTGLLHDIGKSKVDHRLLAKRGPLSPREFEEIKQHPVFGYEICDSMDGVSSSIKDGVLLHHERSDGSGYPMGVKSDGINLYAKIVGLADVYDAATSNKPYARKKTPFKVFKEIRDQGYDKFDIEVMDAFLNNIAPFYIGASVRLNNNKKGKIAFILPNKITNPIVEVDGEFYNTSISGDLKIAEML